MIYFRLRDFFSVLLYRLLAPLFAKFGRGVRVVYPLRIWGARHIALEDNVTIEYGSYIAVLPQQGQPVRLQIGKGSQIGNHVHIICTRRIMIGTNVLIADRVYLSDNLHEYQDVTRPVLHQGLKQIGDVEIGDGAWIGENVCIVGARIGKGSVVGANAVVTRDIPDYCVAVGAPAVVIRRYDPARGAWLRTGPEGEALRRSVPGGASDE